MTNELAVLLCASILASLILFQSSKATRWYLFKWLVAALVAPLLVLIFNDSLNGIVFVFWPGAIVLMSLGAEERPLIDVVYVWAFGIGLNLALYFILGLLLHLATKDR